MRIAMAPNPEEKNICICFPPDESAETPLADENELPAWSLR